jgi:hypothetical protein
VGEVLTPVQVSDVRDDAWFGTLRDRPGYLKAMNEWLIAHDINPYDTYRWELYIIDAPFLKVFTYVRDEKGRILFDQEAREPVKQTPFTVLVSSLPPDIEVFATPPEGGPFR